MCVCGQLCVLVWHLLDICPDCMGVNGLGTCYSFRNSQILVYVCLFGCVLLLVVGGWGGGNSSGTS